MTFDRHLGNVLSVATRLVNALAPGAYEGGRPTAPPGERERVAAVAEALGGEGLGGEGRPRPRVTTDAAAQLGVAAVALREVFEHAAAGRTKQAAKVVNDLLRRTGARPQLDPAPGGGWQLHFHGSDYSLAVGWAAGCASGLAVVLGSDLAGRLGVCGASGCDRVYVDSSRNGAKRFCSTACQNRTKATAYRARHR